MVVLQLAFLKMENDFRQPPLIRFNHANLQDLVKSAFSKTGAVTFFFSVLFALFFTLESLFRESFNITLFILSSPSPLAFHIFI